MSTNKDEQREYIKKLAAEFSERGDNFGWFDELYRQADGDNEFIPWADLEPNAYFKAYAEASGLNGDGKKALVVGCGLGDDAAYLDELGFSVTAFDISPTAIEWAKKLYKDNDIDFRVMDLFDADNDLIGAFDLVLEIYTIQPLPLEIRDKTIDAVARFAAKNGEVIVVTRGREDDDAPDELPWPVSRKELSQFEASGLKQIHFEIMESLDEENPIPRFVAVYKRQ